MMGGDPNNNWWSIINNGATAMHPQLVTYASSSPLSSSNPSPPHHDHHHHLHPNGHLDIPIRGSGLGNYNEEERFGFEPQQKKLEINWEDDDDDHDQVMMLNLMNSSSSLITTSLVLVNNSNNNPNSQFNYLDNNIHVDDNEFIIQPNINIRPNYYYNSNSWPSHHHRHHHHPVSSPTSCITTLSNNNKVLNFSCEDSKNHNQDHSYECNSTSSGGTSKKARVTQSSAKPALKVRKEKLGDRITSLHQLVSPFGKTDTASVLSETIGYIRFLQGQIQALSSPYMRNASGSTRHHQQYSDSQGVKDLRSKGICLVPISCTQHVGNENGADYWAPAALGGGGF